MHVRTVVAAVAAAGICAVPFAMSADASTPSHDASAAQHRPVPERPSQGEAWIQGKVLDRAQRPILDINVEAYEVGHLTGTPVSSSLTYESDYNDERGWYRLYDLKPGTQYKVKYSSIDADDDYKTVWSKVITPGQREAVTLSAQTLTLTRKVDATLSVDVQDGTVKPTQQAVLKISLTSPDVRPITGDLWISIDKKKKPWTTPIKAENDGHVTVKLPKQAIGKHTVTVWFGGNDAVNKSKKSVEKKVTVTRTGR